MKGKFQLKRSGKLPSDESIDFRSSVELILENDPSGLFNTANDLRSITKNDAIEILYRMAIERGVKEAYLNFGYFLTGCNRTKEAIDQFMLAHENGDPMAAVALGQAYLDTGNSSSAANWLRKAGQNPYAPLRLAQAYRALGDELSAVATLLNGRSYSSEAAIELVTTTDKLDLTTSIQLLEDHLEKGESDVLIPLANLYSLLGRKDKEIELLRRSVDAGEPNALHNLGVALSEAGHDREGHEILRKSARMGDAMSAGTLRRLQRKVHRRRAR
jgi:tetratricopeptide (TPR) repeat protein